MNTNLQLHDQNAHGAGTVMEPVSMLDVDELPSGYGLDDLCVLYKDPQWVFVYWELTEPTIERSMERLGVPRDMTTCVLRAMYTGKSGQFIPGLNDSQWEDFPIGHLQGRRYISSTIPGGQVKVIVGLRTDNGHFATILESAWVLLPPVDGALQELPLADRHAISHEREMAPSSWVLP